MLALVDQFVGKPPDHDRFRNLSTRLIFQKGPKLYGWRDLRYRLQGFWIQNLKTALSF